MAQEFLDDFISKAEAARQLKRSMRTIERMIKRRQLSHLPGTDLIHVPTSREALLSSTIKAVTPKRRRSAWRTNTVKVTP